MAADRDLQLGIENHAGTLLGTPDGIRYFAEAINVPNLGVALARITCRRSRRKSRR